MGRPLHGYPQAIGASMLSILPHTGPASYVQIVHATGVGDSVSGPEAGLKYFDWVSGGLTDSGTYRIEAAPKTVSTSPQGAAATTYLLKWVVVATGAEVAAAVDLSAQTVRLMAIGPK
jgi:hypothetical protein